MTTKSELRNIRTIQLEQMRKRFLRECFVAFVRGGGMFGTIVNRDTRKAMPREEVAESLIDDYMAVWNAIEATGSTLKEEPQTP